MWWSTDETEINLSHIWIRSEQDVWRARRDETHFNVMMHEKLKHIWVTSESDLDEMSESDLDKIWVRSELDLNKRKTKCSLMWWCTDKIKIYLSHIWIKFKQDIWVRSRQDLSQIKIELRWWRLNLKFLTLTLRHHTRQYMWFFSDRVDEMIFIERLLTIIQKMKRFSSRKVIFSIDVILEQRWVIASITLEV